eukprot:9413313-Pyramimonas_sp.AAC.1
MRLLMRLQHNNIIRYYGLTKFQPSGKCAVVYEQLCNATLHEAIHNPTIMLDHEARPPLFCHHHMLYGCITMFCGFVASPIRARLFQESFARGSSPGNLPFRFRPRRARPTWA